MTRRFLAPPLRAVLTLLLLVLHLPAADASNQSASDELAQQTPEQLQDGIEQKHPATYYVLASKLFEDDTRDEAVFWFYLGQIRYRFHLEARPDLEPGGDPALFASLSESVGRPLNEYAFGDLPTLLATIDRALEWDAEHENGFTSKTEHADALSSTREGLADLRAYIENNEEEIRRQRTENGLENR